MANIAEQVFKDRRTEIYKSYQDLLNKKEIIESQLRDAKIKTKEKNVQASDLLLGNIKMDNEADGLLAELNDVNKYLSGIQSFGGIENLCKTDEVLQEKALELIDALDKQSQAAEKKRLDLQKQYEKLEAQILDFIKQREALTGEWHEMERLLQEVKEYADIPFYSYQVKFGKRYQFSKVAHYQLTNIDFKTPSQGN